MRTQIGILKNRELAIREDAKHQNEIRERVERICEGLRNENSSLQSLLHEREHSFSQLIVCYRSLQVY